MRQIIIKYQKLRN